MVAELYVGQPICYWFDSIVWSEKFRSSVTVASSLYRRPSRGVYAKLDNLAGYRSNPVENS